MAEVQGQENRESDPTALAAEATATGGDKPRKPRATDGGPEILPDMGHYVTLVRKIKHRALVAQWLQHLHPWLQPLWPPPLLPHLWQRLQPTTPPWRLRVSCPTHRLPCASSLVNWACLWQKSRVRARRAVSRLTTCKPSPSR